MVEKVAEIRTGNPENAHPFYVFSSVLGAPKREASGSTPLPITSVFKGSGAFGALFTWMKSGYRLIFWLSKLYIVEIAMNGISPSNIRTQGPNERRDPILRDLAYYYFD